MVTGIILGVILTLLTVAALYFFFFKQQFKENIKNLFSELATKILEDKIANILSISSNLLGEKKDEIRKELAEKEEKFSGLVEQVRKELREHQNHLNEAERERVKTYSILQQELDKYGKVTDELKVSTIKLNQILSNSRLRGEYGEKIAGDILKASGLIEGTHYIKNKKQETVSTRPDFTFFLPGTSKKINMDAKFPLDNYIKIIDFESKDDKENFEYSKKQFARDIKSKIEEITSRDYINLQEDTLDFVLMFIPNDSLANFINESYPDIFDFAIKSKVTLVSPYQLFGFISIIRQSFEHFYYEERTKKIVNLISEFSKRFDNFKRRFLDIGEKVEKVKSVYEDIAEKSFKQIDKTVEKIEKHKKGLPLDEIEGSKEYPEFLDSGK